MTICNCTGECHRTGRCSSAVWEGLEKVKFTGTTAVSSMVIVLCQHCGQSHNTRLCPYVREIEYHENGQIKRVVYDPPQEVGPVEITVSNHEPFVWQLLSAA